MSSPKLDRATEPTKVAEATLGASNTNEAERSSDNAEFLTVEQTATKIQLKKGTLYNWISSRKLGADQGVVRFGRRTRIHWPTFKEWFLTHPS
jgi:excisionase family DNA binding protein